MPETDGKSTSQRLKEGLQLFLLAFGAALGFYQFVYVQIIVPSRRPPAVTLAVTLEELDRANRMILVRAHLIVRNAGDTRVWVPALWWNVYGVSFSGEARSPAEYAAVAAPLVNGSDTSFTRYSSVRRAEVVASGRVADFEYWYQPRDETTHEQLFLVPEGEFDVLQILAEAEITKSLDRFAPTRWAVDAQGGLSSTLMLKADGWAEDHQDRVRPFLPKDERDQRLLIGDRTDAGHNETTASIRLKPASTTAADTSKGRR